MTNMIHNTRRMIIIISLCHCLLLKAASSFLLTPTVVSLRKSAFRTSLPSTTATIPTSSVPLTSSSSSSSFDWEHQWYPVVPVKDLETDRPNKITLLGRDFCVWASIVQQQDGDETIQWHAFADVCPHRLVPLSEGRIENNLLQCAYHGWEFNDNGSCARIPQVGATLLESQTSPAVTSSRACATAFPVRVEQELLWIFPSTNQELASQRQPALIDALDDPRSVDTTQLYMRDLPYSWDILVENLCDPSHVQFAHHEFMRNSNRYKENYQLNLQIVNENIDGFLLKKDDTPLEEYSLRFLAPSL
jgi:phenylpropionate dioxygenase-like ring-hydroxylating dioxygenase large terminal subunit